MIPTASNLTYYKDDELAILFSKNPHVDFRYPCPGDTQEQKEEKESAVCAADVTEKLEHLNAEDLAKIKEKLAELEEKQKNCDCES